MVETIGHESKEFFIAGEMYLIQPLRGENEYMNITIAEAQRLQNFALFSKLEHKTSTLLNRLAADDDPDVEIFIATHEGKGQQTVAFAIYQLNETIGSHEMGILVTPELYTTRLPFEIMGSIIVEAKNHGVKTLYTTASNENISMRKLAEKYKMSVRIDTHQLHQTVYSLNVDKHPGTVTIQGPEWL